MTKYIAIWRVARRSIEWGIDHAGGSGEILGECKTVAQAYNAADAYDLANGGDGDIGRRFRVANSTDIYCTNCLAEIAPWDIEAWEENGECERCRLHAKETGNGTQVTT